MSLFCHGHSIFGFNSFVFSRINQNVSFFPQMKPEKVALTIELGEDEKLILEILKSGEQMPLNDVKEQTKFSGKKWDKASKTLTKNNLVKVEKIGDVLLMKLVMFC